MLPIWHPQYLLEIHFSLPDTMPQPSYHLLHLLSFMNPSSFRTWTSNIISQRNRILLRCLHVQRRTEHRLLHQFLPNHHQHSIYIHHSTIATCLGNPICTPASTIASATRKKYAIPFKLSVHSQRNSPGPDPDSAVAISRLFSSSTYTSSPNDPNTVSAYRYLLFFYETIHENTNACCCSDTAVDLVHTVIPCPIIDGVFGIVLTTLAFSPSPSTITI